MNEVQRIRKAINWLLFKGVAENDRELAEILGYTKSSFSQIVNGRVPLSDKFVKKLCRFDENINEVWILTGEGEMFKSGSETNLNSENSVTIQKDVWNVIQQQATSLASKDKQIDELMSLLKQQIADNKKAAVRQEDDATSAAVV